MALLDMRSEPSYTPSNGVKSFFYGLDRLSNRTNVSFLLPGSGTS